jgi:hypothetical protein
MATQIDMPVELSLPLGSAANKLPLIIPGAAHQYETQYKDSVLDEQLGDASAEVWDGSAARSHDFYVDACALEGKANVESTSKISSNRPTTEVGDHNLVLRISEDAYNGHAQFIVKVDGVQVGNIFTATVAHGSGSSNILLKGNWDPVAMHQVEVTFLNDLWEGSAAKDRNLYVDGVALDGHVAVQGASVLWTNKTASCSVGGNREAPIEMAPQFSLKTPPALPNHSPSDNEVTDNYSEVSQNSLDLEQGVYVRFRGPSINALVNGHVAIHNSAEPLNSDTLASPSVSPGYGYGQDYQLV